MEDFELERESVRISSSRPIANIYFSGGLNCEMCEDRNWKIGHFKRENGKLYDIKVTRYQLSDIINRNNIMPIIASQTFGDNTSNKIWSILNDSEIKSINSYDLWANARRVFMLEGNNKFEEISGNIEEYMKQSFIKLGNAAERYSFHRSNSIINDRVVGSEYSDMSIDEIFGLLSSSITDISSARDMMAYFVSSKLNMPERLNGYTRVKDYITKESRKDIVSNNIVNIVFGNLNNGESNINSELTEYRNKFCHRSALARSSEGKFNYCYKDFAGIKTTGIEIKFKEGKDSGKDILEVFSGIIKHYNNIAIYLAKELKIERGEIKIRLRD